MRVLNVGELLTEADEKELKHLKSSSFNECLIQLELVRIMKHSRDLERKKRIFEKFAANFSRILESFEK